MQKDTLILLPFQMQDRELGKPEDFLRIVLMLHSFTSLIQNKHCDLIRKSVSFAKIPSSFLAAFSNTSNKRSTILSYPPLFTITVSYSDK